MARGGNPQGWQSSHQHLGVYSRNKVSFNVSDKEVQQKVEWRPRKRTDFFITEFVRLWFRYRYNSVYLEETDMKIDFEKEISSFILCLSKWNILFYFTFISIKTKNVSFYFSKILFGENNFILWFLAPNFWR